MVLYDQSSDDDFNDDHDDLNDVDFFKIREVQN